MRNSDVPMMTLRRAVEWCGGIDALGDALNTTAESLERWLSGGKKCRRRYSCRRSASFSRPLLRSAGKIDARLLGRRAQGKPALSAALCYIGRAGYSSSEVNSVP